jgi:hypothetical protein
MAIPFPEIVTPEVQVQVPAGIVTVLPSAAELIAACTSDVLQLAAVCASAPEKALKRSPNSIDFIIVVIVNPQNKSSAGDGISVQNASLSWFPTMRGRQSWFQTTPVGMSGNDRELDGTGERKGLD